MSNPTPPTTTPLTQDPERIRAITHPLRITLLEYLREVHHATATQCAAFTGESVASCSFHLRQLAKYGYVERAESHGREKPWKLVSTTVTVAADPTQPDSGAAIGALADLAIERASLTARNNVQALVNNPEHSVWLEHCVAAGASLWLTPEELSEITEAFFTTLQNYADRDTGERPADAGRVQFFLTAMLNTSSPLTQPPTSTTGPQGAPTDV
ncbi:winged helix-turn-helix domain-containing protein [Jonesia quinghaiensis]|uniref:winged helix-turn-helix domain-containing protein n=1 Tax=Jonesia quinghaiensis TaxID=262806 RepID=UPI00068493D2|nr:winged helix-turn-helix domain-containing protein [Jonesia quinghaiensis]